MKNKNILIGYTKWLLKWLLITAVILGIAIGGYIYYDTEYKGAEVLMLYLSCNSERLPHQSEKEYTEKSNIYKVTKYKVTKKRNQNAPHAIYAPSLSAPFDEGKIYSSGLGYGAGKVDTKPYRDYFFSKIVSPEEEADEFYVFKRENWTAPVNDKPTAMMYVGRKSLVRYYFELNKAKPTKKWNCDSSNKSEYQKSWNELRVKLKDYKF